MPSRGGTLPLPNFNIYEIYIVRSSNLTIPEDEFIEFSIPSYDRFIFLQKPEL
jgi:hypothetical protein